MAYKFQLGPARLSGSTTFEEAATFEDSLAASSLSASAGVSGLTLDIEKAADIGQKLTVVGVSDLDGGIDVNASKFTVSTAGVVVADSSISGAAGTFDALAGTSLALQSGGISAAGAIAGATTIDASGDLTVGSITMSEFTVDSSGNTDVDGTLNVEGVPTFQAGAVFSGGITTANAIAGATTISGSGALSAGSVTTIGSITGGKLVVGSADMSEADLEQLDGITAGSAAASKALVLDSSKDIAGINALSAATLSGSGAVSGHSLDIETSANIAGDIDSAGDLTVNSITMSEFTVDSSGNTDVDGTLNVEGVPTFQAGAVFSGGITTANAIAGATTISGSGLISGGALTVGGAVTGGKLVVGSADMSEADLEQLDGITAGAASASKALVLDSSKDIAGINALSAATLSGSGALQVGGTVRFDGVADGANSLAHGADMIFYRDDTDKLMKSITFESFMTGAAGEGIEVNANKFRLDIASGGGLKFSGQEVTIEPGDFAGDGLEDNSDNLRVKLDSDSGLARSSDGMKVDLAATAAGTVAVGADNFAFVDADDGASKNASIVSLISAVAGSGLSAASGVLSVTANNVNSVVSGSTLSEGYNFVAATATASAGMVLPSSPSVGDFVVLKAGAGVSNSNFIAVNTGDSNHKIDGGAGPIRIESPFGAVSLVYVVANDWRIV